MQQQNTPNTKSNTSYSTQPHVNPTYPLAKWVHLSTKINGDKSIILASLVSGHKMKEKRKKEKPHNKF